MSEPSHDAREELLSIARALRAHVEWVAASGGIGLPHADAELVAARRGAAASETEPPGTAVSPISPSSRPIEATSPASSRAPAALPPMQAKPAPPVDPTERQRRLEVLAETIKSCTRCGLHRERTQTVFARGSASSGLCFVGEGPGFDEDQQGYPFVGKAGQLLDKMIAAMGFSRDEVYVCNIVKCRPPNNRKPEPDEMAACEPYLAEQLELVQPQVIVALGATAVEGLLGASGGGITRIRGRWRLYKGRIAVMPTFHPAYLLRTPAAKRDVWEDLQAVLRHMGREIPKRGG